MIENLKFNRTRFETGEMPTRLRNGFKVLKVVELPEDLARKHLSDKYPILAWVDYGDCVEIEEFTTDGKYYEGEESDMDLMYEPLAENLQEAERSAFVQSAAILIMQGLVASGEQNIGGSVSAKAVNLAVDLWIELQDRGFA